MRPIHARLLCLLGLLVLCQPAWGYVEARYTLGRIVKESSHIILVKVEKVNKERKLIYYKKVADLKGMHPETDIRHNVGVGGFNAQEQKIPIEWAEVGKLAIFFHNGGASETCIGKYWYQAYAGGAWWNHSHGEPFLARSYCGDIEGLKDAVEKLLKNEAVVVPATVSKTDLRIHKYRTSIEKLDDYIVVEHPMIERTKLDNVAGFSDMLDLPRPEGRLAGAIAADVDGDGYLDLLLAGTGGLRLLKNNQKGNFDDVTDKWGLAGVPGALTLGLADYNRSGKLSLFTSLGKLYTNLGDRFRDDTALLPKTPARVSNPGEAFGWIDIDGDGLPDLVSSVGVRGLAAWRSTGDPKTPFEDVSNKVGLGEEGLGQEPANYLTAVDLDQDGRVDFVLNLNRPQVALNKKAGFLEEKGSGLSFPCLPRPALAAADIRNDGSLGLFVTTSERPGALLNWHMLGTFSADEDKELAAKPDLSPKSRPEVKLGKDTWTWQRVDADANGTLEVRRSSPSPNSSYACSSFDWPAAEKIALHIGSLNGLTVWLNGEQVYDRKEKRAFTPDADKIEVTVKKGENTLLLKVFDEGPVWKTSIRPAPLSLYPPPAVRLYSSDGKGKFKDVTLEAGDLAQLRAESVSAVWGDLNNDGLQDLIVTCATGLVRVYLNLGEGKFRYSTAALGLEQKFKASGSVLADFNNDGRLDLVLLGEDPNPCVLLFSKIAGRHAPLTVRFAGPESATGAVVKAFDSAGKLCATRHISGGDGKALQAAPEAHFALPPGKYRVEVRYSSGKTRAREVTQADRPQWVKIDDK